MELEAYGHSKISIHALREEGDRATTSPRSNHGISIHALREEGDVKASVHLQTAYISIHALREEGDAKTTLDRGHRHKFLSTPSARRATECQRKYDNPLNRFLSTPSARRATKLFESLPPAAKFLSTPSARRATITVPSFVYAIVISIHALREEGDSSASCSCGVLSVFLSTPSARRATHRHPGHRGRLPISIHALREEGDLQLCQHLHKPAFISIHALREEGDQAAPHRQHVRKIFLSTPSARRATNSLSSKIRLSFISIHALREEGDLIAKFCCPQSCISIHALREEGDHRGGRYDRRPGDFYPRPPRGGRQRIIGNGEAQSIISIHALREEGDP